MTKMKTAIEIQEEGGPAFPPTSPLESWGDPNQGMSLRDYFAAQASSALLGTAIQHNERSHDWAVTLDEVAEKSYRFADAMLRARDAKL